ncbi:NUDIX domain-containing protein [Streptomyces albogriseolus]|uniref:NUDIX domain-containing protein n=1 Tax=Streptomyces albogriseolus TaxID=1887 RepID=UPI003F4CFB34
MTELVERVDDDDRVIGLVDRGEAIRRRWLHRVATVVCRDTRGRILVHRRPPDAARFPDGVNFMVGGASEPGETYEEAAARELTEELGVRARPRFVFRFRCAGVISPYWLGLHEAVVTGLVAPRPGRDRLARLADGAPARGAGAGRGVRPRRQGGVPPLGGPAPRRADPGGARRVTRGGPSPLPRSRAVRRAVTMAGTGGGPTRRGGRTCCCRSCSRWAPRSATRSRPCSSARPR